MKKLLILVLISSFLGSCSYRADRIAIQPFNDLDQQTVDSVSSILNRKFDSKVYVLSKKTLPKSSFVNVKSPRYRADSLLKYLKSIKPDSIDLILGLTSNDISTTKRDKNGEIKEPKSRYEDWGIFGLGYRPGPACVISTFRIRNTSKKQFIERIQKIATHEIGHNIGLKHCPNEKCVMQDAAETIATVDKAGFELCDDCRRKVD